MEVLNVTKKRFMMPRKSTMITNYEGNTGKIYNTKSKKTAFLNYDTIKLIEILNKGISIEEIEMNTDTQTYQSVVSSINTLYEQGYLIPFSENEKQGVIRRETDSPALTTIQLEVTRRCNLRCKHCYLTDYSGKDELTTEEVLELIDQASKMGVHEIHITGGEPTVRKDLKQILTHIYDMGMHGKLYTNGTVMKEEFIDFLKDLGIDAVKVSLDGFKPKTHDDFRKAKNGFNKTVENIKKMKEKGISVEVTTIINKLNISEVDDLIDYFKNQLKVEYHLDSYVPMGHGLLNEIDIAASDEEFINAVAEEFVEILQLGGKNITEKDKQTEQSEQLDSSSSGVQNDYFCGAGNSYVFITSRGLVKFCPTMPDEFNGGNLREDTLRNIWLNGPVFQQHRYTNCKYIQECPHAKECKGGCRSRSLLKYGGMVEPDLQMCKMFYQLTGIKPPSLESDKRELEKI